jgi:sugar lactone lactonase YvrE
MNLSKLLIIGSICFAALTVNGQQIIPSKVIVNRQSVLGEGSLWHPVENVLYRIDIDSGFLFTLKPESGKETKYELGQKVGTVVPIDTGGVMVALKDGIYAYNLKNRQLKLLVSPEKELTRNRFNDGKCDPAGRFWVGSMGPRYEASLYRITANGACDKMVDSVTISNGIVWTEDKKTMYYIDTNTGEVRAFDYDNSTGDITNARVVIKFPSGIGMPDGMSIDSEGMLWIAHWGGYCVGRWNPATGKMIAKIEIPAPNVTSCAFGGKNLDVLYITTASTGMSANDLIKYPDSGKLFVANPGVKGVKANLFITKTR